MNKPEGAVKYSEIDDPKEFERVFESRAHFNSEAIALMKADHEWLDFNRSLLNIPKLTYSDDHIEDEKFYSKYERDLDENSQLFIEAAILGIQYNYSLPFYFKNWLKHYLFYREFLPTVGVTLRMFFEGYIRHPDNLEVAPLTSVERKLLNQFTRGFFGSNPGRTPKKDAMARFFNKILKENKNTKRRSRNLEQALEVKRIKKEEISYKRRLNEPEEISEKKTYLDAVTELIPPEESDNDHKAAQKFRKQVERANKRWKASKKVDI